jgi:hypothetical protein
VTYDGDPGNPARAILTIAAIVVAGVLVAVGISCGLAMGMP